MNPTVLNWDPPKVSRAAKIPEEQWEKHRPWIFGLHAYGISLLEIMAVMLYHSIQEGTFFQPTHKQYVSRLKKWGLRRYGLHQTKKSASSDDPAGARASSRSGGEDNVFLRNLQHHQWKCPSCRPTFPNCSAIQQNVQLAAKHGTMSDEEIGQKLDLAEFYLAAKDRDDAWTLYAEILSRSLKCSDLDRLLIAIKIIYSSIRFNQQRTAKVYFTYLLLIEKDDRDAATESIWIMDLLRGMACQMQGDFDLAAQHVQRAIASVTADNIPVRRCILQARRELIAEIGGQLGAILASQWTIRWPCTLDVTPSRSMELLLQWCLEQVEGEDYCAVLNSTREKPWTKAPSLPAFEDFEKTALFCYLWLKYRHAQEAAPFIVSSARENILLTVERLEESLHIPAQLIFSVVSSMRADVETASFATERADFSVEQIARQAVIRLKMFTILDWYRPGWGYYRDGSTVFNEMYASLSFDTEATDEQIQFKEVLQSFVRQFVQAQFPQVVFNQSPMGPESYAWSTPCLTGVERSADEGNETQEPRTGPESPVASTIPLGTTIQPAITVQPAIANLQNAISTPPSPTQKIRTMSESTLPIIHEIGERPMSFVSVDMLAAGRSSLSSSKASLRSFQSFGRGVTELLLKRGGSDANQLPSEVMDRDSHSSWSLRRLTGASYWWLTSEMSENGAAEQDTIMEDAPYVI